MEHFFQHFLTDMVNKALNKFIDKKVRKIFKGAVFLFDEGRIKGAV